MASIQSKLIKLVIKNQHLLEGRLKRQTWDMDYSIPAFRQMCVEGARRMPLPPDIEVEAVEIDGISRVEWLVPAGALADKAILYTPGGGYVSGNCEDHRPMVAKLTAGCGVRTLLFDPSLAPEHPFPGALNDAITAYRWLLSQGYRPEDLMIVGESAGGGLCLATLLGLKEQGLPLPAAAVAMSPWTDLALTGESYTSRLKASIDPPGMSVVCSHYYAGEHDRRNPLISPLYGDLQGLPPLYISVGTDETMLDDSIRFAERAQQAGVNVTLKVEQGMIHCYPLMAPMFPEATRALADISAFIRKQLAIE